MAGRKSIKKVDATATVSGVATEATLGAVNDRVGTTADTASAVGGVGTISSKLRKVTQALDDLKTLIVLAASENHLGKVGGESDKLSKTITTSNGSAYTSGDNVGAINTIEGALRVSGGKEILMDLDIWDKDNQKAAFVIDYWDASPAVGTYTDNAAQVMAGDHAAHLGSVSVASGDYITTGAIAVASLKNIGLVLKGNASANIFFTIKTTGTPTYTSTSGLILKHGFLQD